MKTKRQTIWIAACSWRGFITDVAIFETQLAAKIRERRWRAMSNPDYDESAVFRRTLKFRTDKN
jgi:hypothetical protein